ncbi:MAG: histidinol dehydrogenase [Oscillospiraceae bacterium]|jgi:histidinol dehydrogenase|nr:histidinol dehydrogenase [Oscillospiraceae bacterium]
MIKVLRTEEEIRGFRENLKKRSTDPDFAVERTVRTIINEVKTGGDEAVKSYTLRLDCDEAPYYRVPDEVIARCLEEADDEFISSLKRCAYNIAAFHEKQMDEGFCVTEKNGVIVGQRVRPLDKVGIYVPGGTAAYPSSVLMTAIPAKTAGVGEIIMVTPPRKNGTPNPDIMAAAKLCGVDKVFLCGGAQAVAALAYGTAEIPKVAKIVGPGNVYVTMAKKLLFGLVDIDMIAGPSEILIIADKTANPSYIAADLLSQAEHDVLASSVLITDSDEIAAKTARELEKQLEELPRKGMIKSSLINYGAAIVVGNMDEAVALTEEIAPEHCEVLAENPLEYIGRLNNIGSLFLGEYSPEPLGDYFAGPNHVLPTNGTARFFSPLGVDSFYKKSGYVYYPESALKAAAKDVALIAGREDLTAHANAVKIRIKEGLF